MTQGNLNQEIVNLQCKHTTLTEKLVNYLSIGSPKIVCYNRKNVSTAWVLKVLRRYQAFSAEVTFATKIEFNRIDAPDPNTGLYGSVQVDLFLDLFAYTPFYTGTGSGEDIARYYENAVNNTAHPSNTYEPVVRVGNTLYIYSYDTNASFSDNVLANSLDTDLVTTTVTNLQNKTEEILDLWNSITHEELCCLLGFAKSQTELNIGASTSSPCNC